MNNAKKYVAGIDPGFGEAGVVIYTDDNEQDILAYATFTTPVATEPAASRAMALADQMVAWLLVWIQALGIKHLDIGIETPVFTGNADSFAKQWRTVQEIESGIFYRLSGELVECWVTEIHNVQSKVLACNHGRATKAQMVAASPFRDHSHRNSDGAILLSATLEAVADAWAHGLGTWGVTPKGRINYTDLKAATVRRIV